MSIVDTNSSIEETLTSYKDLMEKIRIVSDPFDENSDIKRGNANINGLSVQGKLQQIANESSKIYALKYLVSPRFAKAHQNGDIHIHDLDYYLTKTTTCTQIDLGEMLRNGIWNEHGWIRPPKSIQTAAYLAAVVLQSHQNQQHGGQSYPNFDFDLAPYVRLSYDKNYNRIFSEAQKVSSGVVNVDELEKAAWEQTEHDTLQAMEGFVHNINTMHSRGGGQVVFASVNFGLDTSKEGRLVSKCLMQAQCNGLGKGETPIFPILIVKVKEGINYNPEDPNYDIFKMSMEVTAKRLFPNWVFEDSPFNADFDDLKDAVATMGCIDYDETITISKDGEKELTYKIGDFFKNQEKSISKQSLESKAERFARFYEKQGDVERASKIRNTAKEYYTGINQWAKKFFKDNGRKPAKGDFEEYFGRDFPRHKDQRKFDSSLFNLWDSYLELKVKSHLDSLGYSEKNTLEECTNDKDYCRNKYIGNKNNKSFQADFCIPSEKLIIEVQDFATHDKERDDAPYYQRTNEYKHGPSYHKEKRDYFATFGYRTIEMWEDEIKSNNFKELN